MLIGSHDGRNDAMGEGELKFPKWQAPLQEVILEFDFEKLPGKLQEVETLILERFQQPRQSNDGDREQAALNGALGVLRLIRRDRLAVRD
jgi:hypothetical protein